LKSRRRIHFLFLNIGHFLDHLILLIFATAAAVRLSTEWGMSYSELIPYATPGFVAFGLCAIPAGWLADRWSREGMMAVYFFGIGSSAIFCALAQSAWEIAISLTLVGIFAAIYHPVGLALVVHGRLRTGVPLAINGIFGNMGVASAALLTGYLIDASGWRLAFVLPGAAAIAVGLGYVYFLRGGGETRVEPVAAADPGTEPAHTDPRILLRIFTIVLLTTAIGGLIFQSTTFALPKIFAERLQDIAATATLVGWYSFLVFSVAAFAQLLVGYLVDHYSVRLVFAVVAALQAGFFYTMVQLSGLAALLVAILFMLVVFGQIPINDVLVGRITRSEWRARAYAIRYIVTFSVMASAVPLIAWLHAEWGFDALFQVLAVAAGCILFAVLLLPSAHGAIARR